MYIVARKCLTWPALSESLFRVIWIVWSSFFVTPVMYRQICE